MRVAEMAPPPLIQPAPTPSASVEAKPEPAPALAPGTIPAINWEQFMGVKLFAWIGGLALFLGVALFFITLIFPIQFERQWITIGWALEGAALLWLLHRVPHEGLRLAGAGLLLAAFARLALNLAVLDYPRSSTPIFNWYLYAYGVVIFCLFAGARLLAPPRHRVLGVNGPPILAGLGIVLAFLLLNIEIADYFSAPGSTLTFQFTGNFARDMTYSIAWALFALGLLVTMQTGLEQPLEGVTLETPARGFLKAVQVEGSSDGNQWRILDRGQPVFCQPDGPIQLYVSAPAGPWSWLRLTMDDQRTLPVPFTGARVHGCAAEPVPTGKLRVSMGARDETPGESRLTLYLDAANVDLATIEIQTPEPLFTRQVRLAAPQVSVDAIREQTLAEGVLYRVGVDGLPASSNLVVRVERRVPSRELLLLIRNQDSPPLPITGVSAEERPVHLVLNARSSDLYHLLIGNNRCAAPSYDLAGLAGNLKGVPVSPLEISAPARNPNYRAAEVLPGLLQGGAPLDVSAWRFRKEVKLNRAGAQQVELDLDVLARAGRALSDLRLVRAGKQLPFILERTSISRTIPPGGRCGSRRTEPAYPTLDPQTAASRFAPCPPRLRRAQSALSAADDSLRRTNRRPRREVPAPFGRCGLGANPGPGGKGPQT
jgi:hypothetical protein